MIKLRIKEPVCLVSQWLTTTRLARSFSHIFKDEARPLHMRKHQGVPHCGFATICDDTAINPTKVNRIVGWLVHLFVTQLVFGLERLRYDNIYDNREDLSPMIDYKHSTCDLPSGLGKLRVKFHRFTCS